MILEQEKITAILEKYAGKQRDALLPILWDIQTQFGYIDPSAVQQISHLLRVPEADIYGVIGFYSLFHTKPTGEKIIRICNSPTCHISGAETAIDALHKHIKASKAQNSSNFTIEETECLGVCDSPPAALVSTREEGERLYGNVSDIGQFLNSTSTFEYSDHAYSNLHILVSNSESVIDNYQALHFALNHLSPSDVITSVEESGLIGRGGAAFPTGLKWKLTRDTEDDQKFVVCNADESEPGTFKDRYLMENNPQLLLEGIILAGYAIGANKGYLFIRGEYPKATEILQTAIDKAIQNNVLGEKIMGSDFSFHIEIRRGAGAYICGEETALFEAIEGKRGFPRIKPPYPTTHGLFGKPTVVNNVETLCNIPFIIQHGAEWLRQYGTSKSSGPKLVSVSGNINQPGVYEIEPGISLQELLENYCKGIDGTLQAVLMGGAAGTFLTPTEISVKLTFEDLREIGSTFGSGAIMVFNDEVDLHDVLKRLGHFFRHESCGKCLPCQLGTQRQIEILDRIKAPIPGDNNRLKDVGLTMTEASICGLGQTASSAVLSAMEKFPHYFESGK